MTLRLVRHFAKIQDKREQSDYEIGFSATNQQALEIYESANEFVAKAKHFLVKV
ncbi:MAG: hypothetical protein U0W24_11185 [Bacteroidales bacterium]